VLALEQTLGVTTGHDATMAFIERALAQLERRQDTVSAQHEQELGDR